MHNSAVHVLLLQHTKKLMEKRWRLHQLGTRSSAYVLVSRAYALISLDYALEFCSLRRSSFARLHALFFRAHALVFRALMRSYFERLCAHVLRARVLPWMSSDLFPTLICQILWVSDQPISYK